jgi:hypothetical protein
VGAVRNRYADWIDRYETDPVHGSPRRSPSRHRRRGWAELAPVAPPALHYLATAPERSALAAAINPMLLYQLEQRLSNGGGAADTGLHLDR